MTIQKSYHFHAAHRNHNIPGKCRNLHGHTYHVEVEVLLPSQDEAGVTILFADIDKVIEPIIKGYDHTLLIDVNDPLYAHLQSFTEELALSVINGPTSAENVAMALFRQIEDQLPLAQLRLKETTSSTVVIDRDDIYPSPQLYKG